ncbi:MAG: hypothetical protein GY928_08520 [Colwellia sp.]|nr:hypothetical protein [Colwellia sp.]
MTTPTLYNREDLATKETEDKTYVNGKWVYARPYTIPSIKQRFVLAYKVFTGKCDAIKWEEQ